MDQPNERSYHISNAAKFFHELPHLNVKLQRIQNATFDDQNKEYVESLAVFISIPILVLIVVLLVYLFYSICICLCGTSDKSKKNIDSKACKVFMFIFALFCGATFIVGLIGSWKIHDGMKTVHNSTEDAAKLFNSIKNDTKILSQTVNVTQEVKVINNTLSAIIPDNTLPNVLNLILNLTNQASGSIIEVYEKMQSADIDSVPSDVKKYENYRWIFTFVIVAVLAIIGLSFICVIFSRCFLIMFTIFALLALIICMLLLALTFGLSVASSDFCYEAKPYIKSKMNGMVEKTITEYYIECPQNSNAKSPFEDYIVMAEETLTNVSKKYISDFITIFSSFCRAVPMLCTGYINQTVYTNIMNISSKVDQTIAEVKELHDLVDCKRINNDLNNSLSAFCSDIFEGLVMTFANFMSASFAFIIIVFCSTYTAH